MQRGGLSDDSWFLHPSPVSSFLPTDETVSFQRTPQALASARQHQDAAPLITSSNVSPTSCTRTPADLLAILATYVGPEPALLTAIANAYTQDAGQSLLRELEIPLTLEEFAKVHMVVQRRLPHYTGTVNPAPPPRGPRSPHYADPQAATPWLKRFHLGGSWLHPTCEAVGSPLSFDSFLSALEEEFNALDIPQSDRGPLLRACIVAGPLRAGFLDGLSDAGLKGRPPHEISFQEYSVVLLECAPHGALYAISRLCFPPERGPHEPLLAFCTRFLRNVSSFHTVSGHQLSSAVQFVLLYGSLTPEEDRFLSAQPGFQTRLRRPLAESPEANDARFAQLLRDLLAFCRSHPWLHSTISPAQGGGRGGSGGGGGGSGFRRARTHRATPGSRWRS